MFGTTAPGASNKESSALTIVKPGWHGLEWTGTVSTETSSTATPSASGTARALIRADLRRSVIETLGKMGTEAVQPLAKLLEEKDNDLRLKACETLGRDWLDGQGRRPRTDPGIQGAEHSRAGGGSSRQDRRGRRACPGTSQERTGSESRRGSAVQEEERSVSRVPQRRAGCDG